MWNIIMRVWNYWHECLSPQRRVEKYASDGTGKDFERSWLWIFWELAKSKIGLCSVNSARLNDVRCYISNPAFLQWSSSFSQSAYICGVTRWSYRHSVGLAIRRSQVRLLLEKCCATTLGKFFTLVCLCHHEVQFGSGQEAVVLFIWESNLGPGAK